jgi:hypothetical protein
MINYINVKVPYLLEGGVKVKLPLLQAVEAHNVVRR